MVGFYFLGKWTAKNTFYGVSITFIKPPFYNFEVQNIKLEL